MGFSKCIAFGLSGDLANMAIDTPYSTVFNHLSRSQISYRAGSTDQNVSAIYSFLKWTVDQLTIQYRIY